MERCFSRLFFVINCAVISGSVFASQGDLKEHPEDMVTQSWMSTGAYSLEHPRQPQWELTNKEGSLETAIKAVIQAKATGVHSANNVNNLINAGTQIKAGGGGGNEKLGLTCFSPSADSMLLCQTYESLVDSVTYANNGSQVLFNDASDNAIFAEFDGYPFIVTQVDDTCYLENDYITTIKYDSNSNNDTAYGYDCSTSVEHFEQAKVDATYYDFFSFSPENDAHFYAGVVMQMYHSYLDDLFPNQKAQNPDSPDCPINSQGQPNGDYCLKRLSQRAHALGVTGGHMDDANWDGEYVNYGNGQWAGRFYSLTTIDLVAHESMHALSEWNGDLDSTGQAGAIGEGLGDISAIAANHYLEGHLVDDQQVASYKSSTAYGNKRDNEWAYAWDIYVNNELMRIFELPSFDGYSIEDARDYAAGKAKHHNGGVLRKLFYELVVADGWSHEQAFKLFLGANVSCFTPSVTFDEMGTCLLSQVDNVFSPSEVDAQQTKLDERLHRLGIFASNTQIDALSFTQNKHYDHSEYWVSPSIDVTDIEEVRVDWGDGTQVNWSVNNNNGTSIEAMLTGEHLYASDAKHVNFSLSVLKNDGTWLKGLSQDYIHASPVLCTPTVHNPNGEISQFTFMGQEYAMSNSGYQYVDATHLTLPNNNASPIVLEGNFTGKNVTVFADMNRDGYFNRDELLAEEKPIVDGTLTLSGLSDITVGKILLRVVVDEFTAWGCGGVSKGMAIDILTQLEAAATPPTAEFSYEITGTTSVQFNAVTDGLDDSRNPEFTWSYQQTGQSEVNMGQGESLPYVFSQSGTYSVNLVVAYDDGSQDTRTQDIVLGGICMPEKSNRFDGDSYYIDKLEYAGVYSGLLNSSGRNPGAYVDHDVYDYLEGYQNQMLTLNVYTNVMSRIWAKQITSNQGIRTTFWVDFNRNGVFESSEHAVANNLSYQCESISNCRIKSSINMLMSDSTYNSGQNEIPFKTRVKVEYDYWGDFDEAEGDNACNTIITGEVEDQDLYVDPM
ncbi:M4 family metallopeptidase [Shewanella surugensis]|uniref:M4 family metallopeptidase n=1 Tax=Shewanella surugensis TaxID=212020 RepID=A0ABT0LB98_9GAMM|nr:M4 family metallopeptidase [Shewanella surugensis]MCL1124949.1 M4 family metallopeptidase [Shewanella surugensis]